MKLALKPKLELTHLLNYLQAKEESKELRNTLKILLDEKTPDIEVETQITQLISSIASLSADEFTVLGICYRYGIGVTQDDSAAFNFFKRAAELGSLSGQSNLGVCYHTGLGVAKDLVQAVTLYQQAAAKGWSAAQHNLAICYQKGLGGLPVNLSLAADNFKKAADQGIVLAQFQIAECLAKGAGVAANIPLAIEYYQRAAEQGHAAAKTKVGLFCLDGKNIPQDTARGLSLLTQAADENVAEAQRWLGQIYDRAQYGVTKDSEKAIHYYELALKNEPDSIFVLNNLALLIRHHAFGYLDSGTRARATELLEKAVSLGCTAAMFNLAGEYRDGGAFASVPQDFKRAFDLYSRAAHEGGDLLSLANMANAYRNGEGVTTDKAYAKKLFYQTAHKYTNVMNLYGKAFEEKKMPGRACVLYYAADYPEVVKNKFKERYPQYRFDDLNAAVSYFQTQNTPEGLDTIGFCYQLGLGVPKDLQKAIEYYKQAIQQKWYLCATDLLTCYQELFKSGKLVLTEDLIKYFNQPFTNNPEIKKEALLCLAYGSETLNNYSLANTYFEHASKVASGPCEESKNNMRRLASSVLPMFFSAKEKIRSFPEFKEVPIDIENMIASYLVEPPKKAL